MTSTLLRSVPVRIANNLYVGYPKQTYPGNAFMNYRGDMYLEGAFSEIGRDFSLLNKIEPAAGDAISGTPAYSHVAQGGATRRKETIGAVD